MITRRTLLAALGLSPLAAAPAVASIPPASVEPFKGHGVVQWAPVPNAALYIVTVKNQHTKEHMTWQTGPSDNTQFIFKVDNPDHVFKVKMHAVSFDGMPLKVGNYTLDFEDAT